MSETLREYQKLLENKELALLNLAGVVIHAIGNLNLNDPAAAQRTLMLGLEMCVQADAAIEEFRKKVIPPHSQSQPSQSAAKEAA